MTLTVAFRGEQSAMSSKHTGVPSDDFNEYIKSINSQEPISEAKFHIDDDAFKLGNHMLSSNPDAEPIEVITGTIEEYGDMDKLVEIFGKHMEESITTRLRSGDLADIDIVNSAHQRLIDIVARRLHRNKPDTLIWLRLHRCEANYATVDWPVAAYIGVYRFDLWERNDVQKALTRLKRNRTIVDISVKGPIPKHWYYTAI